MPDHQHAPCQARQARKSGFFRGRRALQSRIEDPTSRTSDRSGRKRALGHYAKQALLSVLAPGVERDAIQTQSNRSQVQRLGPLQAFLTAELARSPAGPGDGHVSLGRTLLAPAERRLTDRVA